MNPVTLFAHENINICVCGAKIDENCADITKKLPMGNIYFRQCVQCQSWVQSPRITKESLTQWYDSGLYSSANGEEGGVYFDYFNEEEERLIEARIRYEKDLKYFLPPSANILEIGCATGSLLAVLKQAGHKVVGVDLSKEFANWGVSKHQLEIQVGDFLDQKFPENHFDLVLLMGTVSNLQRLDEQLKEINRLLKPKGKLYFNIPFADNFIAKIYGDKFWMFTPSIPYFMTRVGLEKLLNQVGFKIEECHMDWQKPTLGKLLGHLKWGGFYKLFKRMGCANVTIPFRIPIPVVHAVVVVKK